ASAKVGRSKGMLMAKKKAPAIGRRPSRAAGRLPGMPPRGPALRARASDDVQMLDAARQVLLLGLLAVQLDHQPQLVHRVRVAQRVLVADQAGLVEIEEMLVER